MIDHLDHLVLTLHVQGREFEPKAHLPVPGALDLCFARGQRR